LMQIPFCVCLFLCNNHVWCQFVLSQHNTFLSLQQMC
jgi:hypothetical protein